MALERLQARVAEFGKKHGLETDVEARLLDLVSEVGELSKEALKSSSYGKSGFKSTDEWASELGDAFFSLLALANETDVDAEVALDGALRKYERRLSEKGGAGSGS